MKIVVFEDSSEYYGLVDKIRAGLDQNDQVILFKGRDRTEKCTDVVQLEKDLLALGFGDATLIVADSDLSKLITYSGLGEPTVRLAADRMAIPECSYARGENEDKTLSWALESREGKIAITHRDEHAMAVKVFAIARGFQTISDTVQAAIDAPGRKSPGKLLGYILGKPHLAEKIAQYASGDQARLHSFLKVAQSAHVKDGTTIRRMSCLLGYWLWDSVLRFPGVVCNSSASASYLNIDPQDFKAADVQRLFEPAIYHGPFAGAKPSLWWRSELDDLLANAGSPDGKAFAEAKLQRAIAPCRCVEDLSLRAGYYCVFREQPVSLEKSKPGLAWFPRGADLARISVSKFEELEPWL